MARHNETGKLGEELAAKFLTDKGYLILERNYRFGRAEVDIIVQKDKTLIFVEVKTRKNNRFGFPEEFVDKKKQKLMRSAAEEYSYSTQWNGELRFDVIAITNAETDKALIEHFEDVFFADDNEPGYN